MFSLNASLGFIRTAWYRLPPRVRYIVKKDLLVFVSAAIPLIIAFLKTDPSQWSWGAIGAALITALNSGGRALLFNTKAEAAAYLTGELDAAMPNQTNP